MERQEIFDRLARLGHQPVLHVAALFGISINNSIRTLQLLDENDGLTAGKLTEELGIAPPSVTQIIKKLEGVDAVERVRSQGDSRVTYITMTPAGKKILNDRKQANHDIIDRFFAGFTEEDIERLNNYLERLISNATSDESREFIQDVLKEDGKWDSFMSLSSHFKRSRDIMLSAHTTEEVEKKYHDEMKRIHGRNDPDWK